MYMTFAENIKSFADYIGSNGRNENEIIAAEKELKIKFASDYRKYLQEIGLASFDGHEFTGITDIKRLDVISITKENRNYFGNFTAPWYVIEEANIFGIVIWQDSNGIVYQTMPNSEPKIIANSLLEYINL